MSEKVTKEIVKGVFYVLATLITTAGTIYVSKVRVLESEISSLQKENIRLVEENEGLQKKITEFENSTDPDTSAVDEMQGTIDDLMKQLSDAEIENGKLSDENKTLSQEKDRLTKENEELRTQDISPTQDESGKQTKGEKKKSSGELDLLTVCPPYETAGYDSPDLLKIMGVDYAYAFSIREAGYAYFNLNSNYETFSFDVGHVDGTNMNERSLTIYLGDKPPTIIDLSGDMELTHCEISVSGVTQMKITMNNGGGWPTYGIVNAKIE